ncbi:MAG: M48 family metallopeptidase [Candidatus Promineofilum sp.]|nr:M48 family metallopeptidase [Promineifilum sp.]
MASRNHSQRPAAQDRQRAAGGGRARHSRPRRAERRRTDADHRWPAPPHAPAQSSASLSDEVLEKRAQEINRKYFNGRLRWQSVRYVTNQNSRFGSCTPEDGTIRLSHRLATMPVWVRDYVLVHELAHLVEGNHGKRFWKLVNRYPLTERARGYLMAVGMGAEARGRSGPGVAD